MRLNQFRLDVAYKFEDARAQQVLANLNALAISSQIQSLHIVNSYSFETSADLANLKSGASLLIDPVKEIFADFAQLDFDHVLEIGFLPGVTDNVGATTSELFCEALNITEDLKVYSSRLFLLEASLNDSDLELIASTLHNPLIETCQFIKATEHFEPAPHIPKVSLQHNLEIQKINLDLDDTELAKLGKEGILDFDGTRRGPLALELDYMKAIQAHFQSLGRQATDLELESIAQTWSEHCKHTIFADPIDDLKEGLYKGYIKAATNQIRKDKADKDFCESVFTDNSGAIVFDDDYLITHKVETHNSPSALDPFGGAITGIVGVNRDAIGCGMGAKPIANLYGFCFADPQDQDPIYRDKNLEQKMLSPKRIMEGVIDGVKVGGNCSGIPTVHGFSYFDKSYKGKPLVFVGTLGLMPRLIKAKSSCHKQAQPGDYIVVLGGKVGLDGIHGATFSSVTMDSGSPATAVQIGDPITQKKLSDAIIKEARDRGLYTSITDNGAGGISCSVAEMARECGGCYVDLEKVPLKYPGMQAWQIWISESQERMTMAVPPENWSELEALMKSRGVEATVIGHFTDSGKCEVKFNGATAMDLELEFLHDGLPKRHLKTIKPSAAWLLENTETNQEKPAAHNFNERVLAELAHLNHCSKEFISQQYDHEVQALSLIKPLQGKARVNGDTAAIKPVRNSNKAAIISYGLCPEYSNLDSYFMAAKAIDQAVCAAVATGADPDKIAILDNFCWCSSNEPERLYQLKEAARACHDYAIAYGTPFISGKDSMFNDFRGYDAKAEQLKISALPTLLISALAVIDDYSKTLSLEAKFSGDLIYMLNAQGKAEPNIDAAANLNFYKQFYQACQNTLMASSVSLASNSLVLALMKKAIASGLGFEINSSEEKLFAQRPGAILVTVDAEKKELFEKHFAASFDYLGSFNETTIAKFNNEEIDLTKATQAYRLPFSEYLKNNNKEFSHAY